MRAPYALSFFAGIAGSLHCVGMCGAFPLALGSHSTRPWVRQLLYNAGRLNALVFIGAISGLIGAGFVAVGPVRTMERVLATVTGFLMVIIALEMLGVLGRITTRGAALAQATVGRALAGVMRSSSPAAPVALGVFNAFLPCQLIYAFAAEAAATRSPLAGSLTMLAFGLGTVPAMLLVGLLRPNGTHPWQTYFQRAASILVLGFGILTMARGWVAPSSGVCH